MDSEPYYSDIPFMMEVQQPHGLIHKPGIGIIINQIQHRLRGFAALFE